MNWRIDEASDYLAGILEEPRETALAILDELGCNDTVPGDVLAKAVQVIAFAELDADSATEH